MPTSIQNSLIHQQTPNQPFWLKPLLNEHSENVKCYMMSALALDKISTDTLSFLLRQRDIRFINHENATCIIPPKESIAPESKPIFIIDHQNYLENTFIRASKILLDNDRNLLKLYNNTITGNEIIITGNVDLSYMLIKAKKISINSLIDNDKFFINISHSTIICDQIIIQGNIDLRHVFVKSKIITIEGNLKIYKSTIKGKHMILKDSNIYSLSNTQTQKLGIQSQIKPKPTSSVNNSSTPFSTTESITKYESIKQSILDLQYTEQYSINTLKKHRSYLSFLRNHENTFYDEFKMIRHSIQTLIDSVDTSPDEHNRLEFKTYLDLLFKLKQKKDAAESQEYINSSSLDIISFFIEKLVTKILHTKNYSINRSLSIILIEFIINKYPGIGLIHRLCLIQRALVCDSLLSGNDCVGDLLEKINDKYSLDLDNPDNYHNKPLHYAAILGNEAAIRLFLEKIKEQHAAAMLNLNIHEQSPTTADESIQLPLPNDLLLDDHENSDENNIDNPCFSYLNSSNHLGYTPLHLAVISGSKACVQLLIEEGADYSKCNLEKETPLDIARAYNNDQLITYFQSLEDKEKKIENNNKWLHPLTQENKALVDNIIAQYIQL